MLITPAPSLLAPQGTMPFQLRIAHAEIVAQHSLDLLAAGPTNARFAADQANQANAIMREAISLGAPSAALDIAQRAAESFSAARDALNGVRGPVGTGDVAESIRLLKDGLYQARYASEIAD